MTAEVDFVTLLGGGGAEVGFSGGFARLGLGGFFEGSQDFVVGDGRREAVEVEFGDAIGEEILGPERDGGHLRFGAGSLVEAGYFGEGLAGWGDPEFHLFGDGEERVVCG